MSDFTDEELLAFIDERLSSQRSSLIEQALRSDPRLATRLSQLISELDHGGHSIGQIWRRERLSCPPRAILAALLERRLGDRLSQYLRFHLETIECRICQANLADLQRPGTLTDTERRSQKIFQSSAGHLRRGNR